MLPTKIVVIGAGSASFGLNTIAALLKSKRLLLIAGYGVLFVINIASP